MKKIIFIVYLIIIGHLFSQEIVENKRECRKKFNFILENEFTLEDMIDDEINLEIWEDKIWIHNVESDFAIILNLKGEIVKIMDQKGKGPGEFNNISGLYWDRKNDYITLADITNNRFNYFDQHFSFIESNPMKPFYMPFSIYYVKEKKLRYDYHFSVKKNGKVAVFLELNLIDKNNKRNTIYKSKDIQKNIVEYEDPIFNTSQKNIYLSSKWNVDDYKIKVFDSEGKLIKIICKNYSKIKKNKKTIAELKRGYKKVINNFNLDYEKEYNYYPSIKKIFSVKNEIWSLTQNRDHQNFFDVFDKSGKLIRQSKPQANNIGENIKFYKDKFYEITGNYENGYKLKVYKIEEN